MYIFTETTVLLDSEFYRVIFDGNLTKLQSEVGHTGVTCSQSEVCHTGVACLESTTIGISISGPWEAVQRAYCTLAIQSKKPPTLTDRVPTTNEEGEICKTEISGVLQNKNCMKAAMNKGLSAIGTHECKICGLRFATTYFLRKHMCNVYITDYGNSSDRIVSVEPELDPVDVTTSESESAKETSVAIYNEDEQYQTMPKERCFKRRTNVKFDQADGLVVLTVKELDDIMKNVCPNQYGKYVCPVCSFVGNWKSQLRSHMSRNHIQRRWKCEICGALFGLKEDLIKHNISCHTNSEKVQCPICLEQYANIKCFRMHMRFDHKESEQPRCSTDITEQNNSRLYLKTDTGTTSEINIVQDAEDTIKFNNGNSELESAKESMLPSSSSATYVTDNELTELISNQAGSLQFSCPKCPYIAYTRCSFREHMMRRHMERKWRCDICAKCFATKRDLRKHNHYLHDVPGEVHCIICKKSYRNKVSLETHMTSHRRKWKCDTCSKSYVRKTDLETHRLHVHTSAVALNTCSICNHIFPTINDMHKHMVLHQEKGELNEQENCFKCSVCNKTFKNPYTFNKHLAAHLKKLKPPHTRLPCSDCNKIFVSNEALAAHKKTHNAKTVKCPLCPKTFLNKYRLIDSHLPFHSKKRDYICSVCGKGFPLKSPLIAHEKLHSNIKPYGCPHCKLTFKLHYACKRHMVVRHGYQKQAYELIHQRMLINPQGLTLKDLNSDTETNLSNADNTDIVDNESNAKTVLISEMGASDTSQETEHMEMTNTDLTDIIHSAVLTEHANVQLSSCRYSVDLYVIK